MLISLTTSHPLPHTHTQQWGKDVWNCCFIQFFIFLTTYKCFFLPNLFSLRRGKGSCATRHILWGAQLTDNTCSCLLSMYLQLSIALGALLSKPYHNSKKLFYFHFTDKEAKAQRHSITSSRGRTSTLILSQDLTTTLHCLNLFTSKRTCIVPLSFIPAFPLLLLSLWTVIQSSGCTLHLWCHTAWVQIPA